jgi:hypothetical protein
VSFILTLGQSGVATDMKEQDDQHIVTIMNISFICGKASLSTIPFFLPSFVNVKHVETPPLVIIAKIQLYHNLYLTLYD